MLPAQGFFDKEMLEHQITAKEHMALLNALPKFHHHLKENKVIRVVTDNMSVKAVINKGSRQAQVSWRSTAKSWNFAYSTASPCRRSIFRRS